MGHGRAVLQLADKADDAVPGRDAGDKQCPRG